MDILRNTKSIFGDNAGNALNWETTITLRNMKYIFGDNACKGLSMDSMKTSKNMKSIFGDNACKRFKLRHNDNFQEYGIHIWRQ